MPVLIMAIPCEKRHVLVGSSLSDQKCAHNHLLLGPSPQLCFRVGRGCGGLQNSLLRVGDNLPCRHGVKCPPLFTKRHASLTFKSIIQNMRHSWSTSRHFRAASDAPFSSQILQPQLKFCRFAARGNSITEINSIYI